jgi:hypothetical protein
MTTRWFVEVSRVDADTQKERYCVEALQWQQALQQARKLRGDRGALSRFAIELLDSGYRATDPAARLRYTISRAPLDAPLSGDAKANGANGASKAPAKVSAPPADAAAPMKNSPSSQPPKFDMPKPAGYSKPPGAKPSSVPPAATSSSGPLYELPRRNSANSITTSPAVPKPRRSQKPPKVTVKKPNSAIPASNTSVPPTTAKAEPAIPRAVVPSSTPPPASEPPAPTPTTELTELDPMTGPAAETAPQVPGLELVAMRKEEPTDAVPITYREYSFALAAGAEPHDLERHARAAWEQVRDAIRHRTSQKFVQIALFDHRFEGRPSRPPLAVLAWKDWRGDPVVQIRGASTAPAIAPASSASIVPRPTAPFAAPGVPRVATVPSFPAPQGILSSPASSTHRPHATSARVPAPTPVSEVPIPALAPVSDAPVPAPAAVSEAPVAAPIPVSDAPVLAQSAVSEAPAPENPSVEPAASAVAAPTDVPQAAAATGGLVLPVEAPATAEPKRTKTPSRPVGGRRRGSSEDLIGELFEQMHSLHFAPDIVSGADYVLNVLTRVMPSEGVLIHVFDINTRQFVVVRAAGPNPRNVLLHRTPDTFKLFRTVLRRSRALVVGDAAADQSFQSERWERLGVVPRTALCGAVKQGGRYLGFIELVNAAGGAFHETDVNALDYMCTQFADFVASKPIVIDEDAVLPKT